LCVATPHRLTWSDYLVILVVRKHLILTVCKETAN
jgi:hypothetical protein